MGQEKFRSLTKIFLNDSKIVIFVFDITNIASFNELDYWFEIVENELGPKIIKGIAANKKDLMDEQQVDGNLIEEYAKKKGVNYSYTTATNIEDFKILLKNLVKLYIDKKYELDNKNEDRITPAIIRKKYTKKKKCC
jgi:GTPase SAR1 family protein